MAFGIVLCSQCFPIDGEAKTDEPFIYCIPYKRLKIRAPRTWSVTHQALFDNYDECRFCLLAVSPRMRSVVHMDVYSIDGTIVRLYSKFLR